MKKILLTAIIGCFSAVAMAQTKPVKTVTISTPSVQCEMCKTNIEKYLKRVDGIAFVNVKYKQKQALIKYYTDRTNEEAIKAHIANAGYDANEIAANPDSYKLLPKCCKKPEESVKPKQ